MRDTNYTEEEIAWAKAQLKRKRPGTKPTEEQAVKLLNTFGKFKDMLTEQVDKDTKTSRKSRLN